jgi:hypothetical protein
MYVKKMILIAYFLLFKIVNSFGFYDVKMNKIGF